MSKLEMDTKGALVEVAYGAKGSSELRQQVLSLLCPVFDAEVGVFVAVEQGVERRTCSGVHPGLERAFDAAWQVIRREVRPVKEQALLAGSATDRRVLRAGLERTQLFQRVMAPVRGTETLFIVPKLGAEPLGLLALGRCGGTFSAAALEHATSLVPALSVACRAVAANRAPIPDLTAAQNDLLDYLELGWGTREIAEARGTSFFTVRNQLSLLYRRLDVTNRAEAIGLRRRVSRAG